MKKVPRYFASSLLKLTLASFVLLSALISIIGSPTTVKSALSDSGVYDHIVGDALGQSLEEDNQSQANLNAFKQSAEAALTPATVQSAAEQVVDGVHGWLSGSTDTPMFRIDLTDAKSRFIAAASETAATHVTGLPACTAAQEREIGTEVEVLDLTCRPRGVTAESARAETQAQLNEQDFLKDPVLTSETLLKDEDGKGSNPLQNQDIPKRYQALTKAPWVLLGLALLWGAAVFFLSDTKRQGAKSLAVTVGSVGAVLLVLTYISGKIFDRLTQPGGALVKEGESSLKRSLADVLNALSDKFNQAAFKYALICTIIGVGAWVAIKFLWKTNQAAVVAAPKVKAPKKTV